MKIYMLSKKLFIGITMMLCIAIIVSLFYVENNIKTFFTDPVKEPVRNGDTQSNKMAFTCNVDWGEEVIPTLLDTLEEKDIKITFFITGRWASNNVEMLKLIHSKGHEIGNHGYGHKMHSKISEKDNHMEIKRTEEVIVEILGIKPKYFAPPSGDFSSITLDVASNLRYVTILWNIDTIDWRAGSTKEVIYNRVMKKDHNGAILLMHPKPATIEALPDIIDGIKKEGVKIGTVSYLLQ